MNDLLQTYQPAWKTSFEALRNFLESALQGYSIRIEHVGSTAIPGLPAKPILDIDIIALNKEQVPAISACLEKIGYIAKGEQGIPGRFAFRQTTAGIPFRKDQTPWQTHHLYVCLPESLALKNHLLFRDALLSNPELAGSYASLKKKIAGTNGITREDYTRQKTAFILDVLAGEGITETELNEIREANR